MANFTSNGVISRNIPAQKVNQVTELQSPTTNFGKAEVQPMAGIRQQVMLGERKSVVNAYIATTTIGKFAGSASIEQDPKYPILVGLIQGKKLMHPTDEIYLASPNAGKLENKPLVGISTIGLGYTPPSGGNQTQEVRRWPRNWYGDNIKS